MPCFSNRNDLLSGCTGLLDPARFVRNALAQPLPMLPAHLSNGSAVLPARRVPPADAALADLLPRLGAEFIDWGTHLCMARAVQAAERLVPGVSLPYLAYTTFAGLSDVARGNLISALHRLPQMAIGMAPALRVLADALGEQAANALRALPCHEPVVIGLAVCALLHHLQHPAASRPRTAATIAAIHWLRRIRAAADLLGSLRSVLPRSADSADVGPRRAPTAHPGGGRNHSSRTMDDALSVSFPAVAAARADDASPCAVGGALLLPGACAVRKKVRVVRPPPPVKRRGVPPPHRRQPGNPVSSRRRVTVTRIDDRRPSTTLVEQPPAGGGEIAVGGAARVGSVASGVSSNKESIAVAKGKLPAHADREHDARRFHGAQHVGNLPPSATIAPAVPHAPHACMDYQTPEVASRQIRRASGDARSLIYCVPLHQAAEFERAVTERPALEAAAVHWLQAWPVRQVQPPAGAACTVARYRTADELHRGGAPAEQCHQGELGYSVLTVSVRPEHAQRHHRASAPLLEADTFRLLQVPQWDGSRRTFVVYFLNQPTGVCRGARPGMLEVEFDSRNHPTLTDAQSGYRISGTTLDELVWGIEKLSCCRLLGDLPDMSDDATPDLLHAVQNLQVEENNTWCGGRKYYTQTINHELRFLPVKSVQIPGSTADVLLFKGSFVFAGPVLLYMDVDGRLGRVGLQPAEDGQHAFVLESPLGNRDRFLLDKGLRTGVRYDALALVELLESQDMVYLPPPALAADPPASPPNA